MVHAKSKINLALEFERGAVQHSSKLAGAVHWNQINKQAQQYSKPANKCARRQHRSRNPAVQAMNDAY